MLNTEQILIKVAEYLDFDLTKLGIRRSAEKTRLYKRQSTKETIEHIISCLYKEIESFDINFSIKEIIDEFMQHYDYITNEIHKSYDNNREKEIDWLMLKHFVIPFFSIRISERTSLYNDRLDKGLPGGDFWYLPTIDSQNSKIVFPINKLMKWFIDLHGGSNQRFYFLEKYKYDENNEFNISDSTLKDWHDNFVIPKMETIKEFAGFNFQYDGVFKKDKKEPFQSALNFIKDKSLTQEKLKVEIPNTNNIIDKLYSELLTEEDKEKLVFYLEERWNSPKFKQIEYLFTISRVIQKCYKDLCDYFNVNVENKDIYKNKILQLVNFFALIYNTLIELNTYGNSDKLKLIGLHIHNIKKLDKNSKEGLDFIMSSISNELELYKDNFDINEVFHAYGDNKEKKVEAVFNSKINEYYQEINKLKETQIYQAIKDIENITDDEQIIEYINNIEDTNILYNIGDYFQGNNYLTNEKTEPNIVVALTIHCQYSRVANTDLDLKTSYQRVINLLTFSYYPRYLPKSGVDEWLNEFTKMVDINNNDEYQLLLAYKGYHLINQDNKIDIVPLIKKFIELTKEMKPDEYMYQFLFIAQEYMHQIKNQKMYKKLKKINEKHPEYLNHIDADFFFYQ